MTPVIVLVTFYSRCGTTETLASAAAVGAVQQRANIRLRRVPDTSAERTLAEFSNCRETLQRMHKEYVAPTEADLLGADAIVLVPPAGFDTASPEWANYFGLLAKLGSEGKLTGKVAVVVDTGSPSTLSSFSAAIQRLGLSVPSSEGAAGHDRVDAAERAREQGRRVTDMVRALRRP